jgi:uroporphyrinogen III methyltransferase/synthase
MDAMQETMGHVWIAGAGPGDPGLVTVAAAAAIAAADVILYDALASPALLRGAREGADIVYVGKRAARHALPQDAINALLVHHARAGRRVVRLKGGDPFVFGRGSEEALACRAAAVPFTVIPGVTSAIAGPAYAGIPVTHRGVAANFLVVTGNDAGGDEGAAVDWEFAARADTLLILMGVSTLGRNMERLRSAGKPSTTPVACIRWGTRPDQSVVYGSVDSIADAAVAAGLTSPVVTVVGNVAALASELAWFGGASEGPLAGRSIVVTRARAQASDLAARFEALGALVIEAPVIGARPRSSGLPPEHDVSSRWDWIVFTSANGVEAFFGQLRSNRKDARALGATKVACVGAATAEALARYGVLADFVPSKATTEALGTEIESVRGGRILLAVSALTDDRLAQTLRGRGALIEQVAVYDTVAQALDEERRREVLEADAVVFSSASTARNLHEAIGETALRSSAKLISMGAQTSLAVKEAFGRLDVEAATPSIDALVAATLKALSAQEAVP